MEDQLKPTRADRLFVVAAAVGVAGGFLKSTGTGLVALAVVGVVASIVWRRLAVARRARPA